jgi:hypothetical protein
MTGLPEQAPMPEDPDLPAENAACEILPPDSWPAEAGPPEAEQVPLPAGEAWLAQPGVEPLLSEPPPLFRSWSLPGPLPAERIPHLGHLCMLGVLAMVALLGAGVLMGIAFHFHLYGVSTAQQAASDIHYTLGSMAALYLFTLLASLLVFPLFWHKSLFAGLQWNFATAMRLRVRLLLAAGGCFVLAMVDELVLPGPTNAPIDKFFHTSLAAWLLFAFGVTFAPFFEETLFRGFLLPGLATAWDWTTEKITHTSPRPLSENGHPQWSLTAMVIASVLTSIPFALVHAEQTAHAIGPFLLLVCVSLVLCWVRLSTRSLAASVLVHSSYNFLLFVLMLFGTGGFQHMDKM